VLCQKRNRALQQIRRLFDSLGVLFHGDLGEVNSLASSFVKFWGCAAVHDQILLLGIYAAWYCMACRQCHKVIDLRSEQRILCDEKRVEAHIYQASKRSYDGRSDGFFGWQGRPTAPPGVGGYASVRMALEGAIRPTGMCVPQATLPNVPTAIGKRSWDAS
jgi:hypothetical protein